MALELDFHAWLVADLLLLKQILGDQFADEAETVTIKKSKLLLLEQTIQELLPAVDAGIIILELKKLRFHPFRELLNFYPDYVQSLAARLAKSIYPLVIEGGEISVDHDRYVAFTRSLTHVFRNMVDHGIEVILNNDGKAIDLEQIREVVLHKELATLEQWNAFDEEDQIQFIFHASFTTQTEISQLSGRGIGLNAVKKAVAELQGDLRVASNNQDGTTTFWFSIPLFP